MAYIDAETIDTLASALINASYKVRDESGLLIQPRHSGIAPDLARNLAASLLSAHMGFPVRFEEERSPFIGMKGLG